MRLSTRAGLLGVFIVIALLAAACSSGDTSPFLDQTATQESGGADPTGVRGSGTEADLEAAANASFTAFTTGDDQTYFNQLSRSCRELQFAVVQGHLDGRRFRIDQGGIDRTALGVAMVDITSFDGSEAEVVLTLSGTSEPFLESLPRHWIFEDASWRLDDCDEITPAQGGLAGAGADPTDPLALGGIADIDGWLVSLAYVNTDAEADVIDFGGSPAPAGSRLVVAQLGITYIGPDASAILGDAVAFAMVNGSTVYGDEADCGSDGGIFLDLAIEVGPGDSLAPMWVCRAVAAGDADDMLLRVTQVSNGTDRWFELRA